MMNEINSKDIKDLNKKILKFKRGIREYQLKFFEINNQNDIQIILSNILNTINKCELTYDLLYEIDIDEAYSHLVESLVGLGKGWLDPVMSNEKAKNSPRKIVHG